MDPLSLASGIAGLITLAGAIVSTCYSYGCAVKDGPAEIQRLVDEIMSLAGVLTAVRALIDRTHEQINPTNITGTDASVAEMPPPYSMSENKEHFKHLAEQVTGSQKALEEIQDALSKAEVKSEHRFNRVFKRLVWPLKRDGTLELITRVERYKSLYVLSLSTANVSMTLDARQTLDDIRSTQVVERMERQLEREDTQMRQIHQWLCPVKCVEAHQAARQLCLQGTGTWMLKQKVWKRWLDAENCLLWLYGIPGSGKTVLTSTLLDYCATHIQKDDVLLFFYCDFRDKDSQQLERVVGALITQYCSQVQPARVLLKDFANAHRTHGTDLSKPTFDELRDLLVNVIAMAPSLYIVVDALDECVDRIRLTQLLMDISLRKDSRIKILVSSRQEADIESALAGQEGLSLRVDAHDHEIESYISHSMTVSPRLRRLPDKLRSTVQDTLVQGCQGMFRWVQCQIEALGRLRTDRDIRQALTKLPKTLYDSYKRILEQIDEHDRPTVRKALLWLSYGPRAMTLDELTEAVVIDSQTRCKDPEAAWNSQDLLSVIGSLARYNSRSNVIEFAHHSVKEFLETAELEPDINYFHIERASGSFELAEAMLTYLLMTDFTSGPCGSQARYRQRLKDYPLLPLSARFWPYYARDCMDGDGNVVSLAHRLLGPSATPHFRNWTELMISQGPNDYRYLERKAGRRYDQQNHRTVWRPGPVNLTPLYYAASFGLLPVVRSLIDAGVSLNAKGGRYGGTALHAAIFRDHVAVAKLLISSGSDLGIRDSNGMTAIAMGQYYSSQPELLDALQAGGERRIGLRKNWPTRGPRAPRTEIASVET